MGNSSIRTEAVVIIALLAVVVAGCGRRTGVPEQSGLDRLGTATGVNAEPLFLSGKVTYCRVPRSAPEPVRVQFLLDSSGSMTGYQKLVPELVTWMQHSLSLLRQSAIEVSAGRICQFSTRFGEIDGNDSGECSENLDRPFGGYVARSDTNLHMAIRSAQDYDLTLILTDGVAATGSLGAGDCASGVDAGCVARSLRQVIVSQPDETRTADWGLWLVPLVASYDGAYYTEQKISPDVYDSSRAKGNVQNDLRVEPHIGKSGTISDGTLKFSYKGPRTLLLMILARRSEQGRAMVQALQDRTEFLGYQKLAALQDFSGRTGMLAPIELFPGFVDSVEWRELTRSPTVSAIGTIDASLSRPGAGELALMQVNCPPNAAGEGYFSLGGVIPRGTRVSGCVEMHLLPAIRFQLESRQRDGAAALASFIAGYQTAEDGSPSLDLHLTCGPQAVTPCEAPLEVDWRAHMHYGRTADCLADPNCQAVAPGILRQLSTLDPSNHPHLIYGIGETVEEFFRLTAEDAKSQFVAGFQLCRGGP